jgi:hypothetical protein
MKYFKMCAVIDGKFFSYYRSVDDEERWKYIVRRYRIGKPTVPAKDCGPLCAIQDERGVRQFLEREGIFRYSANGALHSVYDHAGVELALFECEAVKHRGKGLVVPNSPNRAVIWTKPFKYMGDYVQRSFFSGVSEGTVLCNSITLVRRVPNEEVVKMKYCE